MRILIVEDNLRLAGNIKEYLELEHYKAEIAGDGEEAVAMAGFNDYDLIILDIDLPKMNGKEVCGILRDGGKKVPIIMLTAQSAVEDKIEGLNLGADDYLAKPFVFEELLARIRALLRRNSDKKNVVEINDLVVDFDKKLVSREGVVVGLSPKEWAIVEYLVRNRGMAKNRTEILDHVWGADADAVEFNSDTVEVHVSYLRKKLGKSFILTRKGFGYVIE